MRNLLALLGAVLVTVAIVGWYRGWYQVTTVPEPGGHSEVKIDINGPKIGNDLRQGEQKLEHVLDNKLKNPPVQSPAVPAQAAQLPPGTTPGVGNTQFVAPAGFTPVYATPQGEQYVLPPAAAVPAPQVPRPYPN